eukprot:1895968-Rhodomonas_salina.4
MHPRAASGSLSGFVLRAIAVTIPALRCCRSCGSAGSTTPHVSPGHAAKGDRTAKPEDSGICEGGKEHRSFQKRGMMRRSRGQSMPF